MKLQGSPDNQVQESKSNMFLITCKARFFLPYYTLRFLSKSNSSCLPFINAKNGQLGKLVIYSRIQSNSIILFASSTSKYEIHSKHSIQSNKNCKC